ncbi:MAG TPA: peptidylprolyl isomerase [Thermoplasmatales archaeon]|nr:peptidylprolyl isomerase [Thermoplasmatales archaeon]
MKYFALMASLLIILSAGCISKEKTEERTLAIIKTSMGTITIELYTEEAPKTTENFIKLANDGFYDGLVFHRVIDDFVIQTGGFYPNGTYKPSPYGPINLELSPQLTHVDGAVGMARGQSINSATSQFYICDGPQHSLDGHYAVFGKVIDGMDVVRQIASVETTEKYGMKDWPVEDIIIESITIEKG